MGQKIFAAFFPTSTVDKSRVFLCSCLEENYLRQFVTLRNRKFDRKKIKLLYFGRDSYLRGVDVIKELKSVGYNVEKVIFLATSALKGENIVSVPLAKAVGKLKTVPKERYDEAKLFFES